MEDLTTGRNVSAETAQQLMQKHFPPQEYFTTQVVCFRNS